MLYTFVFPWLVTLKSIVCYLKLKIEKNIAVKSDINLCMVTTQKRENYKCTILTVKKEKGIFGLFKDFTLVNNYECKKISTH